MIEFDGQVAIVTGAGGGIGRETALLLAARGARVIVNDVTGATASHVVENIRAAGGEALADGHPVGGEGAAAAIVAHALDRFGRLDILVNNAGISRPASFGEDSDEDIQRVMAVNLLGPYALMRAAWPVMKHQGYGRILNTSSSAAMGSGISGAYAVSKAGVIGLTKDAALSGRAHGILVNALMPSAHTPLLDKHPDPAFREWMAENFPAAAVAAASTFLVSREMQVMGEVFAVYGGLVQRVAFYDTPGIFDPALSPESMAARFGEIMDTADGTVIAFQSDHGKLVEGTFPRQ